MLLLTGKNGFLGNYIFKELVKNYNIISLGRNNSTIVCDLAKDRASINYELDLVIHCAGKAHILNHISNKDLYHETNVIGTKNLLSSLELSNAIPHKFLFISSVSVYGLITGVNINETSPLIALDPYGKSKIEAEEIVQNWCDEHGVICTILRLPLLVGENPPGNLGAMIRGIKKGYYFNIAGGNANKSMVLATDIAKFILKAAEKGGTYNLSDGQHPTFNELSKIIAIQMGKSYVPNLPKFFASLLAKFGDHLGNKFPINSDKFTKITSTLTFDDTKARMAFGWNPLPVLDSFKVQQDAN